MGALRKMNMFLIKTIQSWPVFWPLDEDQCSPLTRLDRYSGIVCPTHQQVKKERCIIFEHVIRWEPIRLLTIASGFHLWHVMGYNALRVFFRAIHHLKTSRRFVKEFTATYNGNINLITCRNDLYFLTRAVWLFPLPYEKLSFKFWFAHNLSLANTLMYATYVQRSFWTE